ncbi:MAG: hypothetical protein WB816_10225 [Methylocystis sp.]
MLAFEIWKNGEKLAVAGLENSGAISLMLTWVGRGAGASSRATEGTEIEGLDLRVGGIDTSQTAGDQSIEWIEDTALRLGDDITIRLISATAADAPVRSEPTKSLLAGETGHRFAPCAKCGGVRLQEPGSAPASA